MNKTITGNTQYRINFAIKVILKGSATTRNFDNCFEMGDGINVAAGRYKRAMNNTVLMQNLPKYLNVDLCLENYIEIEDVKLKARR